MATNSPVTVTNEWTLVYSGAFSGGVQNVGNAPLVAFVADGVENPPAVGAGGFAIYSQPTPIQIGAGQELWARAICGDSQTGAVILA